MRIPEHIAQTIEKLLNATDPEEQQLILKNLREMWNRNNKETTKLDWVTWVEPFGPNNEPVYCYLPSSTAVEVRKKIHPEYISDEIALLDFQTVHWAALVEKPEDIDVRP